MFADFSAGIRIEPVAQAHSGRGRLDGLVEILSHVPQLADPDVWDGVVEETERRLGRDLEARRFPDHRRDLVSVLRACQDCTGGLRSLARVVLGASVEGFSAEAISRIQDIAGTEVLTARDWGDLVDLLTAVPTEVLAQAAAGLVKADDPLATAGGWADQAEAIREIEALPAGDDTRHVPVLEFVERVAAAIDGPAADEVRYWAEVVSDGVLFGHPALPLVAALNPDAPQEGQIERPSVGGRPVRTRRRDGSEPIWGGGVPIRNRNFTGRQTLLDRLSWSALWGSWSVAIPQCGRSLRPSP